MPAQRSSVIDFLKAAAIVAVVFTHSGIFLFHPKFTAWDRVLTTGWVWFHVPTFLFLSGFLYFRSAPITLASVAQRLGRVLLPYLVASLVYQTSGLGTVKSAGDALYQLATGSAVGIFYYVFVLACCIPCIALFSRLPLWALALLWGALAGYTVAKGWDPSLRLTTDAFWKQRSPLEAFYLGYFLSGWLVARLRAPLAAFAERWRWALLLAAGAGLAWWFDGLGRFRPRWLEVHGAIYTASVLLAIAMAGWQARAPRWIERLSDATYTLYLYHGLPLARTQPFFSGWPPPLRILTRAAAALASGLGVAALGRRVLGPERARRWLGA